MQVVDGILEEIRIGMEINHPKYNQRRIAMVKFLGELYNYRLVDSAVIFKTLYSFITFGVSYEPDEQTALGKYTGYVLNHVIHLRCPKSFCLGARQVS